ncbi:TPA: hypothetical protein NR353_003302 [Legionella pneumophila]|uniref:Uncharacterized protein n=1 Tax=Legionella waltersii TaxID=66969 RepID=A0A0W1AGE2_9GAMM|nr:MULTISPECIES: hypothetical protein [Legionella]KTD80410.1 hypothetical protein Lwal_1107 [Legionella waltersii]SNV10136.1 Uncharacterised protein [Legionella waltersii]HAT1129380.1 hypothetical protein [Legionella pneumophila]HAT1919923.1 hypothetical protein [Legionella pneumophila]HAT4453457.1 hypothetical protein [Legionella pneumophila]
MFRKYQAMTYLTNCLISNVTETKNKPDNCCGEVIDGALLKNLSKRYRAAYKGEKGIMLEE